MTDMGWPALALITLVLFAYLLEHDRLQRSRLAAEQSARSTKVEADVAWLQADTARLRRQWQQYMTAVAVVGWLLWAGVAVITVRYWRVVLALWNGGMGCLGAPPALEVRPRRQVRQLPSPAVGACPATESADEAVNGEAEGKEQLQQTLPGGSATATAPARETQPPAEPPAEAEPLAPAVAYKAVEVSLMTATAGEPLGYSNARIGQLVVRGPDWAGGADDGGDGHLGVVEMVSDVAVCQEQQQVKVRWLKTGVETAARLQSGKPGCRKFCVAVVDVAA
ncbi:hypothetical protein HXX76_002972 [Chlamydomonas incerta]|uniref:MIB/HERC2 domain-containing protein n=1 Tax=Chlamydomonas incerta TaxID=51695 RepID=A0A835TRE9_CHLIN|nr:hypothetical protein HXX76_002972 [Chlamydomonas incerta]|eukprot:KAG2442895.1 hypothetical protein HXX76_002972 [Chlamydomonas incerta]